LEYSSMRIVTPALGLVVIIRAVLGPGFLLKCASSLSYFYAVSFQTREQIGISFQTTNTKNTAINTALGLTLFVLIVGPIIAFNWLAVAVGSAVVGGAIYGTFTGTLVLGMLPSSIISLVIITTLSPCLLSLNYDRLHT